MTLFHVSLEDEKIEKFVPRVPEIRAFLEDGEIPRICLSTSIDGCLSAVSWGGCKLHNVVESSAKIRVYEFNDEDIINGNLIGSIELYQSGKVVDADETGEVWVINQELIPCKSYLIEIVDYEADQEDIISYENLKHCDETGESIEDFIETTVVIISEVEYKVIEENV